MAQNAPERLDRLAQEVRQTSGIQQGQDSIMEQWEKRRAEGKPIEVQEMRLHIEAVERSVDTMHYESDILRSMEYAVLERIRLRNAIDAKGPRMQQDLEVLRDLDRRIAYWQYEEAALVEMLDAVDEYEQYRVTFQLDRSPDQGGVPQDVMKEADVSVQLQAIRTLLPRLLAVRQLSVLQYRAQGRPLSSDQQARVDVLRSRLLPDEQMMDAQALAGKLREELRVILSTPSKDIRDRALTTPKALELQRDMIERHFDTVLARRSALAGKTGADAEGAKESLKDEHARLLEAALSFNSRSVARRTEVMALLVREAHFDQPVGTKEAEGITVQPYGTLTPQDREALRTERAGNIKALRDYLQHFRGKTLKGDAAIHIPGVGEAQLDPSLLMEDLMTTHVIPLKVRMAEPIAEGSTFLWGIHDAALSTVGLDFDIREKRTQAILSPIYERLGLPENYSELSEEEKEKARNSPVVQDRIKSVRKIIDAFKQEQGVVLDRMQSHLLMLEELLQTKPPEELALTVDAKKFTDLPQLGTLATDEEYLGAYRFLLEQIQGGDAEALDAAQKKFVQDLQQNLNINIDVADIEMQLGTAWVRETLYAALAIGAEAGSLYLLVRKGVPYALRKSPAALKLAGRAAIRTTRMGARAAEAVGKRMLPPRMPTGPAAAGERAVEGASRVSKTGRILGPLGIVLVGMDLREKLKITASAQEMPEANAVRALLQNIEENATVRARFTPMEIQMLRNWLDAIIIQQGSLAMLHSLEKEYPGSSNEQAESLKQRCLNMEQAARGFRTEYHARFPITDYLKQNEQGQVIVQESMTALQEARTRGARYLEETKEPLWKVSDGRVKGLKLQPSSEVPARTMTILGAQYDLLYADIDEYLAR